MAGPWQLDPGGVAPLEARPGVYVLGRERAGRFQGIFVGRADEDLRSRLAAHVPGREADILIRLNAPDRFCFQYTDSAHEAYGIECNLYHWLRYPANLLHPDVAMHWDWECPVCGRGASKILEPAAA